MRVAALYDVHGNLPALEAALDEVGRVRADAVLVGGDVVLGPMPRECLARLRELDAAFIRGNTDRAVALGPADDPWAERIRWVRSRLSEEELAFLADLAHPARLEVEGLGAVLFCHGSPRSDEEIITVATPPKRLDPMLEGVEERVVVCGHTHVQFDRLVGHVRLVNPGSVGMPYEGEPGIACWALLGPEVELRRAPYPAEQAAERIRVTGFPGADQFVEEYLLAPARPEEATAQFERLAERSR